MLISKVTERVCNRYRSSKIRRYEYQSQAVVSHLSTDVIVRRTFEVVVHIAYRCQGLGRFCSWIRFYFVEIRFYMSSISSYK